MENSIHPYRTRLLTAVSGWLLFQTPVLAQTQPPPSNPLLTTYLPAIVAAQSTFNSDTLAVVDTLSFRKHVSAIASNSDGLPNPSSLPTTPTGQTYYIPIESPCPPPPAVCQIAIPFPIPNALTAFNTTNPQPMNLQAPADNNAGYALIDSTGTRYVQFVLLTIGNADSGSNPHAELTAQTWYRISNDGGNSFGALKQIIVGGTGFSAFHPMPGVNIGVNGYEFPGDSFVVASNQGGDVLIPLEITPLGPDGNPVPQYKIVTSYMEVHILRGHWRSDNSDLDWELGEAAQVPLPQSTRGLDETAIVEMATNGHCLIVSRGSNENAPTPVPAGQYWLFESQDGCRTWVGPGVPLAWDDGSTTYYAPAAAPFLYKDGNNRIIFMGANSDMNSNGNLPRTRVVAAELDLTQLKLLKRSAAIVDEQDGFDTGGVDLIYGNRYYPQNTGNIFYYTTRVDSGFCSPTSDCLKADKLPGSPAFPLNWHLLNPIPNASAAFAITADATVANQVDWPAVPNAQTFFVYARNPSHHGFWELQGSVPGTAIGYVLQTQPPPNGLPPNSDVEVNVFAADSKGVLTSSNQITIHMQ
jgi:hypothetical protein